MNTFDIRDREDKIQSLGEDRLGYMGIHYDAHLRETPGVTEYADLRVEIQLRTYSQDLWSESSS